MDANGQNHPKKLLEMLVQYPEETGFSTVDKYSTIYFGVAIWDRLRL